MPKRVPLPEAYSSAAIIPGIPLARVWGDEEPPHIKEWLAASDSKIRKDFSGIFKTEHNYLALSGGGPLGAFGAGLLNGWTESGNRPKFTFVTGISAGGLTAPFAFLGPKYDSVLKEVFTQYSTEDFIKPRNPFNIIGNTSIADSAPLKKMIDKHITEELMAEIAAEHRKGRLLLIGTTNLDAERPVIWNIGKIADSGDPKSLDLIRDILLATASIAGAFPPVILDVEAEGKMFDEIHVDGGTVSVVFAYPTGLAWEKVLDKLKVKGMAKLYLIQNFYVDPTWREVEPRIAQIAAYSMFSIIRSQGIGDLYRIYLQTQRDGIDFNYAHIPSEFKDKPKEIFDPDHMTKLFNLGYKLGKEGYKWRKIPPGMEPASK